MNVCKKSKSILAVCLCALLILTLLPFHFMNIVSAVSNRASGNEEAGSVSVEYLNEERTEAEITYLIHAEPKEPVNVILPYHPGDILYVDANPFGKPFYAVYCAETISDREHFEWTKREYGFYKREHPCLYISEDRQGPDITNLCGWFTDYIPFPYAPLDRVKVVDTCDDPFLLKGSAMLKEDPAVFRKWIKWKEE